MPRTIGITSWRPTAPAVLDEPLLRTLLVGLTVSKLGSWMNQVAVGWLALSLTGTPLAIGVLAAASTVPVILLSIPAGVVADRLERSRIVLITSSSATLVYAAMAFLAFSGQLDMALLVALAAAAACTSAIEMPALNSLIGEVAGPGRIRQVVATYAFVFNATRVIGPAIGGILLGTVGAGVVFAINALSYLPLIVGLTLARRPSRVVHAGSIGWTALRDGLAFVRGEPRLALVLTLMAVNAAFGTAFIVFAPAIAADAGAGPEGVGILLCAAGIGTVLGGLFLARVPDTLPRRTVLLAAGAAMIVGQGAIALSASFAADVAFAVVAGAGLVLFNATSNVAIQILTPDVMRGRMMSLFGLAVGIGPLGSIALGVVADRQSVQAALMVGAIIWGSCLVVAGRSRLLASL